MHARRARDARRMSARRDVCEHHELLDERVRLERRLHVEAEGQARRRRKAVCARRGGEGCE
eukprot:3364306-Pleurochrysis_carterae.AAC.1